MTTFGIALLLLAQGAPVPGAPEQAAAEKELRRLWKADFALLPAQREAVAKKFLARGKDVVELPFKFVIFREARELAAEARDLETAFAAVDAMTAAFATEGVADKAAILAKIEARAKGPEELKATASISLDLVEECLSLSKLDVASAVLARVAARSGRDEALAGRCREIAKRLARAYEIKAAIDAAQATGYKDWATPWMYLNPSDLNRGVLNQRENAWSSAPINPSKPFSWVRTVQLTKAAHHLRFDVSANGETGAWMLAVAANGDELVRKRISGPRWQTLEVDLSAYSSRVVTLQITNASVEGVPSNRAYWSGLHLLPPPAGDVVPAEHDPGRLPLPDAAQQAKAEKRFQEAPRLQIKAGAGPSERRDWARLLIEEAGRAVDDTAFQYVLLKKAREAGQQTSDLPTIAQAVDGMATVFGLDPLEEKLAAFSKVDAARKTQEGLDAYLRIATDALSLRRGETALRALSRAERGARTLKNAGASAQARELSAFALDRVSQGWAEQWIWQDTSPGQIVQQTFNQRPHAWQTQPATNDRPFKWKRRVRLPAGQACFLHLDVSSRLPDSKYGLEWTVMVWVNGRESLNKVVKGVEWKHYSIDLCAHAGRDVELELWNKSDDAHGHGQYGYWDRVYLSNDP